MGLDREQVEVAEIKLPIARGNGGGDDVALRGGNVHRAGHGAVRADGDDLAVVWFNSIQTVVELDHAVEPSVGLEVWRVGDKLPRAGLGVDAIKTVREGVAVGTSGATLKGIKRPVDESQIHNAQHVDRKS